MEEKFTLFNTVEERRKKIREIEKQNKELYLEKQKELKKIESLYKEKDNLTEDKGMITAKQEILEPEQEEFDITFYQNLLRSCPKLEELPHYLPKRKNPEFTKIMNGLIASILKEIIEIENFMIEEKLEKEEKEEFKKEIQEKKYLMKELINYRDKKEEWLDTIEEEKENNLLYLKSPSGNYYCFIDEKKIDIEYFSSFLRLLESIKNGTFKNIKVFSNNNKLNGFLEVKEFKTRVIFQRVDEYSYVIISMFIKKVDNDSLYREHLEARINQFKNSLNTIKESLKQEKYIEENNEISLTLTKMLKKEES